jgi:hypothetical protein
MHREQVKFSLNVGKILKIEPSYYAFVIRSHMNIPV